MAACSEQVDEVFNRLAVEGEVKPEPPLLVRELKALGLELDENQVLEAIAQTLDPADTHFSHSAFLSFVQHLRCPELETQDSSHGSQDDNGNPARHALTPVAGEGTNIMGPHPQKLGATLVLLYLGSSSHGLV